MHGDDVAGRILADVFGPRLIEDDYWCYQTFRDEFMGPRLQEADWTLTENDVREWRDEYADQISQRREANAHDKAGAPAEAAGEQPALEVELHALVSWPTGITQAQLLHGSPSVLLLEGERPPGGPPQPGTPLRVGLPGLPRMVTARLAAYGQSGRYLVALGSRAVRGALRVRVDLPGVVRTASLTAPTSVRVLDLSSSGARVRGVQLPIGSDCELRFVPPGRNDTATLRCVVIRFVEDETDPGDLGLAFCGGTLSFRIDLTK
jgi:hypothetical protein